LGNWDSPLVSLYFYSSPNKFFFSRSRSRPLSPPIRLVWFGSSKTGNRAGLTNRKSLDRPPPTSPEAEADLDWILLSTLPFPSTLSASTPARPSRIYLSLFSLPMARLIGRAGVDNLSVSWEAFLFPLFLSLSSPDGHFARRLHGPDAPPPTRLNKPLALYVIATMLFILFVPLSSTPTIMRPSNC
jgi:hypothetical protein